jgi:hypothetical protein
MHRFYYETQAVLSAYLESADQTLSLPFLVGSGPGVTNRCRLFWLTNSALVYEPKRGGTGVVAGVLTNEYSWTQEPKETLEILLHI